MASGLEGKRVLIAGSAAQSCDPSKLDLAHSFVRAFVREVLAAGGAPVVFAGSEPTNSTGAPLTFDWLILREVEAYIAGGTKRTAQRTVVVTSPKGWSSKMNDSQRQLLAGLTANGAAETIYIDDEVHTGGNIGDEQVRNADALIALGGGRGVSDRAKKSMRKGAPVLPLDLRVGSLSEDGDGALALHKKLLSEPQKFFPCTSANLRSILPSLSLEVADNDPSAVARRVVEVLQNEFEAARALAPIDVVCLTALPIELAAARLALALTSESPLRKLKSGTNYWTTEVTSTAGRPYRIGLSCIGGAGNMDAAAATTELLVELKPKVFVMIGIAAGMRGKCKLGDVVVADRIVGYEPAAAMVVDGVQRESPRPETFKVDHTLLQDVAAFLADPALLGRLATYPRGLNPESGVDPSLVASALTVRSSTFASGEKLLRDGAKFLTLRELHGKVEIAEMEAAGVAAACHRAGVGFLIFRGISDFGDEEKTDGFHGVAANGAAFVAVDFLREGLRLAED